MAAHVPHGHHAAPAEEASEALFIREARAPAERLWARRAEQSAAAQRAWQSNDKAGAKVASDFAHALERQAQTADAAAAAAIFAHKQQRVQANEIDLHGLHVEEAKGFLAARLEAELRARSALLVVIYGQGHHSADHKAHIRPAVLDMLRARGLEVREGWHAGLNSDNEGVCTVLLAAPSFDAGLRIKLPHEAVRGAAVPQSTPSCCTIM
jgi:DNA-nicking Smr family endonuclease